MRSKLAGSIFSLTLFLCHLNGNQIEFRDIGGAACNNLGLYEYNLHDDKLSFILIKDNCNGRTVGLSGTWTRKQ
jgi:hypothetical protein